MTHKDQTQILNELKSARVESGLTQLQLAQRTGIPRTTISKIEAGFRNTTLHTLIDLSKAVNLDLKLVKQNLLSSAKKLERSFETLNLIEINQKNILFNLDFFVNKFPKHEIWPVIKANAYGHGLEVIATILNQRKITYFVADSYFEALTIWKINPHQKVLLIGATLPENFSQINFSLTTIVIYNLESLAELAQLHQPIKIHLKINTGMNRQGIKVEEIDEFCLLLKKYPQIELEGIMSHLADADNPDQTFTKHQVKLFDLAVNKIKQLGFEPKYSHLDATAGSVTTKKNTTNAIRLGLGLYGYNPLPSDHLSYSKLKRLRPALNFKTKIINTIRLKAGDKVSYNGTFTAIKPTTIGVLPIGYFDFYDRRLSNQAKVLYHNKLFPIVGKITMNMTIVDFGNESISLYDEVVAISQSPEHPNSIANLSRLVDSIIYETLVKINPTTRRTIV